MASSQRGGGPRDSVPVAAPRRRGTVPASAPLAAPACHAPFVSMFLDQHGGVWACCQNDHYPLGSLLEQSLLEVWRGSRVARIRRALERGDYSVGCYFCEWQVADGKPELAYARWYDEHPVERPDPDWPELLELSISNTCNLQCVMCNGDLSSAIRAHREHRPRLPQVYGDAFFEELRSFVPHLRRVKILGGEPFLAVETLRVIDLLIEMGSTARCHLTSNGTVWSPRVERILQRLPVDLTISVDGATRETYEAIRQGADWDQLLSNLESFRRLAANRSTEVSLSFCLMTENWHEFAEFCRFADGLELTAAVNIVTDPPEMSLLRLPLDELDRVLAGLEADPVGWPGSLGRNATLYRTELDRLWRHRRSLASGIPVDLIDQRNRSPRYELDDGPLAPADHLDELQA